MRVDQVHATQRIGHGEVHRQGLQRRVGSSESWRNSVVVHPQVRRLRTGGAEAVHFDLTPQAQFGHQVANMDPGAAIHLGRILPGQDSDTHVASR
jgi:hypothetical protein